MLLAPPREVLLERRYHRLCEHGDPVPFAFAAPHGELTPRQIDVLHSQPKALHYTKAGAVEQTSDQPIHAIQSSEERGNFSLTQNDGKAGWLLGTDDAVEPGQIGFEYPPIKEREAR